MAVSFGQAQPAPDAAQTVQAPSIAYRPDVDGLRGVAVLAVVGFHAFPNWVPGGFVGVDVFFVISGYLISGLILAGMERGSFNLVDFYARRIRRIFPSLVVVLVACFAFGWFALLADEFAELSKHIAGGAGFGSNFVLLSESGYFDYGAERKPLLHLWSLGIEEQFYIAWPLMLLLAWRFPRPSTAILCALLVVTSFLINQLWLSKDPVEAFYLPWMRSWELLLGALLAAGQRESAASARVLPVVGASLSVLGAVLVLAAIVGFDRHSPFPGVLALLPVLGACALIAGAGSWLNRQLLAHKVLVWFGLISFPLYLWHWPLLSFLRIVDAEAPARGLRLAAVGLAVVLAWATYRWVELPLRFGAHRDRKAVVLLGAILLVGLGGFFAYRLDGIPSRLPAQMRVAKGAPVQDCPAGVPRRATCWGPIAPARRVMLIGDSHGMALAPGLASELQRLDPEAGLISVASGGCMPLAGVRSFDPSGKQRECESSYLEAYRYAREQPPVAVIVVGRWATRVGSAVGFKEKEGDQARGRYEFVGRKSQAGNSNAFQLGLRRSLSLVGSGTTVVFMDQVPELGLEPAACAQRPVRISVPAQAPKCEVPLAEVKSRQVQYRALADKVLIDYPQVRRFDPLAVLCSGEICSSIDEGRVLYRDDDHLNGNGAIKLSRALLQSIAPLRAPPKQVGGA